MSKLIRFITILFIVLTLACTLFQIFESASVIRSIRSLQHVESWRTAKELDNSIEFPDTNSDTAAHIVTQNLPGNAIEVETPTAHTTNKNNNISTPVVVPNEKNFADQIVEVDKLDEQQTTPVEEDVIFIPPEDPLEKLSSSIPPKLATGTNLGMGSEEGHHHNSSVAENDETISSMEGEKLEFNKKTVHNVPSKTEFENSQRLIGNTSAITNSNTTDSIGIVALTDNSLPEALTNDTTLAASSFLPDTLHSQDTTTIISSEKEIVPTEIVPIQNETSSLTQTETIPAQSDSLQTTSPIPTPIVSKPHETMIDSTSPSSENETTISLASPVSTEELSEQNETISTAFVPTEVTPVLNENINISASPVPTEKLSGHEQNEAIPTVRVPTEVIPPQNEAMPTSLVLTEVMPALNETVIPISPTLSTEKETTTPVPTEVLPFQNETLPTSPVLTETEAMPVLNETNISTSSVPTEVVPVRNETVIPILPISTDELSEHKETTTPVSIPTEILLSQNEAMPTSPVLTVVMPALNETVIPISPTSSIEELSEHKETTTEVLPFQIETMPTSPILTEAMPVLNETIISTSPEPTEVVPVRNETVISISISPVSTDELSEHKQIIIHVPISTELQSSQNETIPVVTESIPVLNETIIPISPVPSEVMSVFNGTTTPVPTEALPFQNEAIPTSPVLTEVIPAQNETGISISDTLTEVLHSQDETVSKLLSVERFTEQPLGSISNDNNIPTSSNLLATPQIPSNQQETSPTSLMSFATTETSAFIPIFHEEYEDQLLQGGTSPGCIYEDRERFKRNLQATAFAMIHGVPTMLSFSRNTSCVGILQKNGTRKIKHVKKVFPEFPSSTTGVETAGFIHDNVVLIESSSAQRVWTFMYESDGDSYRKVAEISKSAFLEMCHISTFSNKIKAFAQVSAQDPTCILFDESRDIILSSNATIEAKSLAGSIKFMLEKEFVSHVEAVFSWLDEAFITSVYIYGSDGELYRIFRKNNPGALWTPGNYELLQYSQFPIPVHDEVN